MSPGMASDEDLRATNLEGTEIHGDLEGTSTGTA